MDLFNVVSVNKAQNILNENFYYKLEKEEINLEKAIGRIIYEDIISKVNVPEFRRSTVDGYAVNCRDVAGASESMPAMLNLKGEVLMGELAGHSIDLPGECVYVPTGGMIPDGADAVVMIEYTEKLDEETILINSACANGDNVVQIGDDISIDEVVIKKGTKLRPYEIGVLSSLGFTEIPVFRKPKVGIISTGDEIVGINEIPKLGQVRDINTYLLYSSILKDEAEPINYGVVKDEYELLKSTVDKALKQCDMVLISGGSSVGVKDQTIEVIDSFQESEVLVHGIAVKPGKPTIISKVCGKAVFGLPGHPLSCAIIYQIIVKNFINKLQNNIDKEYPVQCSFSINYHKAKGREEYLPVVLKNVDNKFIADPIFSKSGLITGFSKAYGYIKIDKNIEGLREGEKVLVYKFN
ncbi:molybdopterin-binding protein [Clostridium aciditolerans]|uniref:Molybdopterin molybdenumtransferase n=1 Tax=Clostridium aciditolerans TaxID=339861 RepID=A0A934I240_9CLOT|nr:molybdopterin molybdotransferase MoeA [Clostridium aciditolerans]